MYPRGWRTHAQRVEDGLVPEGTEARRGASWRRGLVIVAWDAANRGGADPDDGPNVVIHAFAHQPDTAMGGADGAPALPAAARRREGRRRPWPTNARLE